MKTKRHSPCCHEIFTSTILLWWLSLQILFRLFCAWITVWEWKKRDLNFFLQKVFFPILSIVCILNFYIIIMLGDNFALLFRKSVRVIKKVAALIHSWTVDLDNWTVHNYSLGAVRIWNQTQVPGISAPVLICVLSKSTRYRRRAQFDFTGHLWLHSRKKPSDYWHQRIGPVHPPCKSQGNFHFGCSAH